MVATVGTLEHTPAMADGDRLHSNRAGYDYRAIKTMTRLGCSDEGW